MKREANAQTYALDIKFTEFNFSLGQSTTSSTLLKDNFYFILLSLFGYLVSYYQEMKGSSSKTRNKNITLQYYFQLGTSVFISLTIRWWFPPVTAFAKGYCAWASQGSTEQYKCLSDTCRRNTCNSSRIFLKAKYTWLWVQANIQNDWIEQSQRATPCLRGECDEPLSHQHLFHCLGFILKICPAQY